jgi:hypothetical protein
MLLKLAGAPSATGDRLRPQKRAKTNLANRRGDTRLPL